MQILLQDLRHGVRLLMKRPGFTFAAIIALGLGIGATTSIFSVADAFLLKPLPYLDENHLVMLLEMAPKRDFFWNNVAPANFLDWKSQSASFDDMAASEWDDVNLTGKGDPERVQGFLVSANFFDTLDVAPAIGRGFLPEEGQPGRERVAILSYGLWERRFGRDRDILGQAVQLDGKSFTVVGVMPKDFDFPKTAELWMPLAMGAKEKAERASHYLQVLARLKPGVQISRARAEMETVTRRLEDGYPETNKGWGIRVMSIREFVSEDLTRRYTLMLLVAVMFVLLIACANVASLQYARSAEREREIAIRLALGAGRWRLIRQLLTESLLLGLLGAGVGLALAKLGINLMLSNMPPEVAKFIAGWKEIGLDARALCFTIGIAVLAGIVSGLAPALKSSRPDLNESLKEGGRSASAGRARQRARSVLVVSEVALALILLVGAGLTVKGFRALLDVNHGFAPESLLTMRINLPDSRYKEARQRGSFYEQSLARLQTIPEVQSAAAVTSVPYANSSSSGSITIEGLPAPEPGELRTAQLQTISPNYFQTMHVALQRGRGFSDADGPDSAPVSIISHSLAERFWPGEDPLGKRLKVGQADSSAPWLTTVGVVEDVKYEWIIREPRPALYRPYRQAALPYSYLAVRTSGDPLNLVSAVRSKIAEVDSGQPLFEIQSFDRVITNSIIGLAYVAAMMAVLGGIALVLSSVGVYGLISYSVTERTHEIGVRMALGAERADVLRTVVGRGILLTIGGLAIGLPVSIVLARLLSSLIFGVNAMDPTTFGGVTLALVSIAGAASLIPARRATRVDPMVALRYE